MASCLALGHLTAPVLLPQEMRAAFEAEAKKTSRARLLLSAAVAAGQGNIETAYEIPALGQ
jgi:hypothetical protein